ncbi:MAG: exodeoxyribonuclease small subunit [Tenuifilum sp.]|jgi:exodeoxyribonuclease VII small subunit|uniref:exodeoxyribonuclease VII small subunit n=1 Tax=Tenuifilum sp. TaxID=2760880 RepID=UPI0024AC6903|nr:exodeoxyribonuclease VII small subunit [Tenuifilum sp.]MDI3526387.1 exodeoxyribonuclease small subunit [Tenuifilum sp.]
MATKNIKYNEAIEEVEEIINQIESNELDIDELTSKIKRASDLLKICKQKLYKTEQDVQKLLDEMQVDS